MTCQQVQLNLSLYLYGDLDFAQEEELERHVESCARCKRALDREKTWHSVINAEQTDVPLELLSACRLDLRTAISSSKLKGKQPVSFWTRWTRQLGFSASAWSMRLAAASFLVLAGFTAGRWVDANGLPFGSFATGASEASLVDPATARIRDIQPRDDHRVRIVVDQVREREITGRIDDSDVRRLLFAAAKDPTDPGIRVDSVEILKDENGSDVRDALLYAVRHDPNAGVRLKALDGLGRFADDPATRESLAFVLEHDDNPGVRSEAIDVLAPVTGKLDLSPELAGTLQGIVRADQGDDYVRMRCMQLLREMNAPPDVY